MIDEWKAETVDELEAAVVRLVGLPKLLSSSSQKTREHAQRTIDAVIPRIFSIIGEDSDEAVEGDLLGEHDTCATRLNDYMGLIHQREYARACQAAVAWVGYIRKERE